MDSAQGCEVAYLRHCRDADEKEDGGSGLEQYLQNEMSNNSGRKDSFVFLSINKHVRCFSRSHQAQSNTNANTQRRHSESIRKVWKMHSDSPA